MLYCSPNVSNRSQSRVFLRQEGGRASKFPRTGNTNVHSTFRVLSCFSWTSLLCFLLAASPLRAATEDFAPLIFQDADPAGTHPGLTEFRSYNRKLTVQMAAVYDTAGANGASLPTNPALGDPFLQYTFPRLAFSCKDATHQVTSFAGPLLRAFPGDTVQIQFTNSLASQRTNLHFHGFAVSPHAPNGRGLVGDFVGLPYVLGTAPGDVRNYEITIPRGQLPGPYWYHAHAHGVAEMQVACGLSGAFYIEGSVPAYIDALRQRSAPLINSRDSFTSSTARETLNEATTSLPQLPHHLLVLKDFWTPGLKPVNGPLEQTVNGKITYSNQTAGSPYVIQYGGADQVWEISNQSANLHYVLKFTGAYSSSFGFYVLGRDGMPEKSNISPNLQDNALMIPPAGRATVVVPASLLSGETVMVVAQTVATQEDYYFQVGNGTNQNPNPWNLIKLISGGPAAPAGVTPWPQLAGAINQTLTSTATAEKAADDFSARHPIDATFVLDQPEGHSAGTLPLEPARFSLYRLADKHGDYDKQASDAYENYEPPIAHLVPGHAQRWIIENVTPEWHVFHIHQIHFRVEKFTAINDPNHPETNLTPPANNFGIPYYSTNQPPPGGVGKDIGEPFYSGEVDSVTIPGDTQVWLTLPLDEGSQISGDFVMHCHLLEHEDNGMMANVVAGSGSVRITERQKTPAHLPPMEVATVKLRKPSLLQDSEGKECTSDIFQSNEFSLVTFGYTTCEGACPRTMETCTSALDRLSPIEQSRISPYFISIDTERDNPQKLAGYITEHKLSASWKALLDRDLATSQAFGARRIIAKSKDGTTTLRHTTTIYLIDRAMHVRAAFDPEDSPETISTRIQKELSRGLEPASEQKG